MRAVTLSILANTAGMRWVHTTLPLFGVPGSASAVPLPASSSPTVAAEPPVRKLFGSGKGPMADVDG